MAASSTAMASTRIASGERDQHSRLRQKVDDNNDEDTFGRHLRDIDESARSTWFLRFSGEALEDAFLVAISAGRRKLLIIVCLWCVCANLLGFIHTSAQGGGDSQGLRIGGATGLLCAFSLLTSDEICHRLLARNLFAPLGVSKFREITVAVLGTGYQFAMIQVGIALPDVCTESMVVNTLPAQRLHKQCHDSIFGFQVVFLACIATLHSPRLVWIVGSACVSVIIEIVIHAAHGWHQADSSRVGFSIVSYAMVCLVKFKQDEYNRSHFLTTVKLQRSMNEVTKRMKMERKLARRIIPPLLPPRLYRKDSEPLSVACGTFAMLSIFEYVNQSVKVLPSTFSQTISRVATTIVALMKRHSVEQVRLGGDEFTCSSNLVWSNVHHLRDSIRFIVDALSRCTEDQDFAGIQLRAGLSTGPLIGRISGTAFLRYDVYGPPVYLASVLLEQAPPLAICITSDDCDTLLSPSGSSSAELVDDRWMAQLRAATMMTVATPVLHGEERVRILDTSMALSAPNTPQSVVSELFTDDDDEDDGPDALSPLALSLDDKSHFMELPGAAHPGQGAPSHPKRSLALTLPQHDSPSALPFNREDDNTLFQSVLDGASLDVLGVPVAPDQPVSENLTAGSIEEVQRLSGLLEIDESKVFQTFVSEAIEEAFRLAIREITISRSRTIAAGYVAIGVFIVLVFTVQHGMRTGAVPSGLRFGNALAGVIFIVILFALPVKRNWQFILFSASEVLLPIFLVFAMVATPADSNLSSDAFAVLIPIMNAYCGLPAKGHIPLTLFTMTAMILIRLLLVPLHGGLAISVNFVIILVACFLEPFLAEHMWRLMRSEYRQRILLDHVMTTIQESRRVVDSVLKATIPPPALALIDKSRLTTIHMPHTVALHVAIPALAQVKDFGRLRAFDTIIQSLCTIMHVVSLSGDHTTVAGPLNDIMEKRERELAGTKAAAEALSLIAALGGTREVQSINSDSERSPPTSLRGAKSEVHIPHMPNPLGLTSSTGSDPAGSAKSSFAMNQSYDGSVNSLGDGRFVSTSTVSLGGLESVDSAIAVASEGLANAVMTFAGAYPVFFLLGPVINQCKGIARAAAPNSVLITDQLLRLQRPGFVESLGLSVAHSESWRIRGVGQQRVFTVRRGAETIGCSQQESTPVLGSMSIPLPPSANNSTEKDVSALM